MEIIKPVIMEKNIKDYLHLYLGCEALATTSSDDYEDEYFQKGDIGVFTLVNKGVIQIHASPDIDNYKYGIEFKDGKYVCGNNELFQSFKPILRPLSDMTDAECSDVYTISRDRILHESAHDFHVIKNANGFMVHRLDWMNETLMIGFNGQIYSIVEDGDEKHIEPVRNPNEITKYLLSIGIDLFGLIAAGLAIDKTTLKAK